MRQWLHVLILVALPISVVLACGTDRESASPVDTTLDLTGVANDCPGGEIGQAISDIFPTKKSLRHVATVNCGQVFKDFGRGKQAEAVQKAFKFFQTTLKQNEKGQLLDPDPSVEARIVALFDAIFAGIGIDLPEIDPEILMEGEYAIGELTPNGPPLLTLSRHAGIDDGGGLFGPVSVFIVQIPADGGGGLATSSADHPCPAGVDDSFDCYPLFFDYTVSPESNVNPAVGLQLGQCNVSPPGVEVLLLSPEGFLPEDDAPGGLDCEDVQPDVAMTGWRSWAWTVLEPVSPLFRVERAYAGKSPVGGRISNFSPVAPADPASGGEEETAGSISGMIVDGSDQSPIQGATVELFTSGEQLVATTTTNSDGNYTFSGLDHGSYVVQASATGYEEASSGGVTLTDGSPDAVGVDIGLALSDEPPPPPPGTDIVVFNDVNVFDNTGMADPDNVVLVENLVGFTTEGPRGIGTEVWVDCRSSVTTGSHGGCQNPSTFRSTVEGQGLTLVDVFEGSLDDLPPEVKVLFLWIPTDPYQISEVNAFKRFAAEGGRVIFVGENAGFYGCCFELQNDLLEAFGATLRNSGGVFHVGYFQLPESSLRPHQITDGVVTLTIAASSEIVLGPGDFALYYDSTETHVLSGVATIDTTPIDESPVAASRSVGIQAVATPTLDTVGRPSPR